MRRDAKCLCPGHARQQPCWYRAETAYAVDLGFMPDEVRRAQDQLGTLRAIDPPLDLLFVAMDLARLVDVSLVVAAEALFDAAIGQTQRIWRLGYDSSTSFADLIAELRRDTVGQAEAYATTVRGAMAVDKARKAASGSHMVPS